MLFPAQVRHLTRLLCSVYNSYFWNRKCSNYGKRVPQVLFGIQSFSSSPGRGKTRRGEDILRHAILGGLEPLHCTGCRSFLLCANEGLFSAKELSTLPRAGGDFIC
jgi:hypothetical protein